MAAPVARCGRTHCASSARAGHVPNGRPTPRPVVLPDRSGPLGSLCRPTLSTEWLGLHLIFGAFLFGLVVPRDAGIGSLRRELGSSIQPLAQFLIPIYFAVAGLNVNLSHIDGAAGRQLVLILLVAVGGKLLGVYAAARGVGLDHRSSAGLASLLNIRGLTELVLLTVGFQIGLLDGTLYSLMVVMAVVTTVMAGPLLRLSLGTAPATRQEAVSPVRYQESR